MAYDEKTKLGKILDDHPWLEQELPKRYPDLKSMTLPGARFMVRRMSVKDASRMSGMSTDKLLDILNKLIAEHGKKA